MVNGNATPPHTDEGMLATPQAPAPHPLNLKSNPEAVEVSPASSFSFSIIFSPTNASVGAVDAWLGIPFFIP